MAEIKLYSYFRSSAAYRVRIALHWKDLPFETVPVHLVKDGGEQHGALYSRVNPMKQLPTLEYQGQWLSQSLAICQFLEDEFPQRPLLPKKAFDKAKVLQLCEIVGSGIHPIQNLSVLQEVQRRFSLSDQGKADWARYWIEKGFGGLEKTLESTAGEWALGNEVSLADAFIVPQVYNARRFQVELDNFPLIQKIEKQALELEAFQKARPEAQEDCPKELKK